MKKFQVGDIVRIGDDFINLGEVISVGKSDSEEAVKVRFNSGLLAGEKFYGFTLNGGLYLNDPEIYIRKISKLEKALK